MSTTKRAGGLGRKIFTSPTGTTSEGDVGSVAQGAPVDEAPKSTKVRTTITIYPRTLSAMEQLKMELRKSGEKVTLSDVMEEAIWALMDKKGLRSQ